MITVFLYGRRLFIFPTADCELADTCLLTDFVTSDDFDAHLLLGDWHLSALQLASSHSDDYYSAYHIRYGHRSVSEMEFRIAGTHV